MERQRLALRGAWVAAVSILPATASAETRDPVAQLRVYEEAAVLGGQGRRATAVVMARSTLPSSVRDACPERAGDIFLSALHAVVSGPENKPRAPREVVFEFKDHDRMGDTKVTVCRAVPKRDAVFFQTGKVAPAELTPVALAANDYDFHRIGRHPVRLLGFRQFELSFERTCNPSEFKCGETFEQPSGYDAGVFSFRTPGPRVNEHGISGAPLAVGGEVIGLAIRKLDQWHHQSLMVVPLSRASIENEMVHQWARPPIANPDPLIAETIRPGGGIKADEGGAGDIPPSTCAWSDAFKEQFATFDDLSEAWSTEGLHNRFRPRRNTLAEVRDAQTRAKGAVGLEPRAGDTSCPVEAARAALARYARALEAERLAGALMALESVRLAGKPHEVGQVVEHRIRSPYRDCKLRGRTLSWTTFAFGYTVEPIGARSTCYMALYDDAGNERQPWNLLGCGSIWAT